ncbi:TOMM precursor leader peptide-binding protein [Streptomyces sp. NPDC050560]|uniref:TOMM precursor leader peptide-binding protein n=1 Tax=Streptomyces sp. NPDC050560 TaxID=3365630 RepID=UPI00379284EA
MTLAGGMTGTELPVGFKRHLRVEVVRGDAVYLLSEDGTTALQGHEVQQLATLLDGTRTLPDVLREAAASVPPAAAAGVIAELARADLIGYYDPAVDAPTEAFWECAGLDGASAVASLLSTPVELVTLGRVDAGAARAECASAGLRMAAEGDADRGTALTLVLCDDYLDPCLATVDRRNRALGRPWLLAKPCGAEIWVGPVFHAPDGPCWTCLAHRLREHRVSRTPVLRALGLASTVPVPEVSLAPGRALGLHSAVLEASKWVAGLRYEGQRAIHALDTRSLAITQHQVRRRPQCPDCGDPGLVTARVRRPFTPRSRTKTALSGAPAASGGNHRAHTPATVLAAYRHLADPVTGVVAELRRAASPVDGLERYVSGRNLALRGGGSLAGLRGGLRGQSGGKGTTAQEAEVGALCEALERYSGSRHGDEPVVRDSLNGLGGQALHPNACQLFADRQFTDRARWNAAHSAFQRVPPPFDPGAPREWTPVWSLTAGTHRLLPTSMLYFGPPPGGVPCAPWADSNGNAAGSTPEDAVVQGFLELVERDAVALWWYNRLRRPAVDLDAFDEPWLARARDSYRAIGRELWVLDLTADFGVPVMGAVSRRVTGGPEALSFGFGAHFDPRLALRRAVTETAQLLPPDDGRPTAGLEHADDELGRWWQESTIQNQPYLTPDPAEVPRTVPDYAYRPRTDLRDDILAAERLVREHGMELLVLDQTRPDVGLPVVKVIVPGMRHFWARFAPGRLFDVPVRLGLRDRPTPYEDLNPVPLFV